MSSLIKRTFNNILWLIVSEIFAKGLLFISTLYLARTLGTTGFGRYSLAVTFGLYLWAVVDMGVTAYGLREIARDRARAESLLCVLNTLRLVLSFIVIVIASIAVLLLDTTAETRIALVLGGLYACASALSPDWVMQGLERMEYLAASNAIISVSYLLALYLFVHSQADTFAAILYRSLTVLLGASVAMGILAKKLNIRYRWSFSLTEWRFHARESIYFALIGVLNGFALTIPVFFLGVWFSLDEVALYSSSQRTVSLLVGAAAVIPLASYPMLSSLFISDLASFGRIHDRFERVMIYLGLPIGAMGWALSEKAIVALYGNSFRGGAALFSIMIWLVPMMFIRVNYGRSLASAGYHRFNSLATFAGAVTSIGCSILLIPSYRGVGASWAVLAGEAVILGIMAVMFRGKVHRSTILDGQTAKVLVSCAVTALLVRSLDLSLANSLALGTTCYISISFIVGLLTPSMIGEIYRKIFTDRISTNLTL